MTSTGTIVTAGKREIGEQGKANSHNGSGTAVVARRFRLAASLKALLRCLGLRSVTPSSGTFTTPAIAPSSSSKSSTSIDRMMQRRSEFATKVEFEIDASRDHWSELQSAEVDSVSSGHEAEVPHQTNSEIVRSLRRQWPGTGTFFLDFGDALVVGAKIAEGGQAEIFEVNDSLDSVFPNECVLKVFKEGSSIRDLQRQWPQGMLQQTVGAYSSPFTLGILHGTVVMNGQFAFQMQKFWGDLRKLMDYRLQYNRNSRRLFTSEKLVSNMLDIAKGMKGLHKHNIIHRDLKASNVLLHTFEGFLPGSDDSALGKSYSSYDCSVADYECSVGLVGTGFWRASEILEALKNHNIMSDIFTQASDVYSYAMTCYEMITGLLAFEDVLLNDYDVVLRGETSIT